MYNLISVLEVLIVTVTILFSVAFLTVAERKTMSSMQRRVGPNIVGVYGLLQAFADALKLLLKEYLVPTQANKALFTIGPVITLIFALLSFSTIPFSTDLRIGDLDLGILFILAFSGMSGYGILLAGWSANSKYAFLGSLRNTAQMISYELIFSSAVLIIILLSSNLNLLINVESQKQIVSSIPLLPLAILFYISCLAETNRSPFDLAEAESELVSGHMTEHSAVLFVFFFLGEYSSILLISSFMCSIYLGGYLNYIDNLSIVDLLINNDNVNLLNTNLFEVINDPTVLSFKVNVIIFSIISIRVFNARSRYDYLMTACWLVFLPIVVAFLFIMPIFLECFDLVTSNLDFTGSDSDSNKWESYDPKKWEEAGNKEGYAPESSTAAAERAARENNRGIGTWQSYDPSKWEAAETQNQTTRESSPVINTKSDVMDIDRSSINSEGMNRNEQFFRLTNEENDHSRFLGETTRGDLEKVFPDKIPKGNEPITPELLEKYRGLNISFQNRMKGLTDGLHDMVIGELIRSGEKTQECDRCLNEMNQLENEKADMEKQNQTDIKGKGKAKESTPEDQMDIDQGKKAFFKRNYSDDSSEDLTDVKGKGKAPRYK